MFVYHNMNYNTIVLYNKCKINTHQIEPKAKQAVAIGIAAGCLTSHSSLFNFLIHDRYTIRYDAIPKLAPMSTIPMFNHVLQ